MALMMACILFNYATVRSIKDGLVVTHIGPEAISFLKTYVVLPSAMIFMIIYAKLCNLTQDKQKTYILLINSIESYIIDEENNLKQDLNAIANEMLESPHLEKFYRQDSLTSEYPGYNGLKNHTQAVVKNFIDYFAEDFYDHTGLDPEFMIQLLCLHDIGKGIGQYSSEQHYYNRF